MAYWKWPEIQYLARLGGWEKPSECQPAKIAIIRGLEQLISRVVTQAFLQRHMDEHGELPLGIIALIRDFTGTDVC